MGLSSFISNAMIPLCVWGFVSALVLHLIEMRSIFIAGGETWLRFRFVAPQIAKGPDAIAYDLAAPDMEHLCAAVALPYMTEHALAGQVIVVSLADRVVEFGAADPDATQYFEAFRAQDGTCIWEGL